MPIRSSRANKGFTLIELLVVISIIALLIAAAAAGAEHGLRAGRSAKRATSDRWGSASAPAPWTTTVSDRSLSRANDLPRSKSNAWYHEFGLY